MARLTRLLASALVVGSVWCPVTAGAQPGRTGPETPLQLASAEPGRVDGVVTDDRGRPLPGAAVTAQGAQVVFAMTDGRGRFSLGDLSPGPYLVRASLPGYVASRRALVEVLPQRAVFQTFRLSALSADAAARPVMAASASGAGADDPASASDDPSGENHGAMAWRLRHLKRSVLREATAAAPAVADEDEPASASAGFAVDLATSVLEGWRQLTGEVQLLTTSSFDAPQELFSTTRSPRHVTYIELGSEAGGPVQWQVQGAITQGDLSSWVLGGTYRQELFEGHVLHAGLSYGAQRYEGGNPVALAAVGEAGRNVGSMFAFDEWNVRPDVTLTLGAKYARYAYLEDTGLFSPSVSLRWQVTPQSRVRLALAQDMKAPGEEEFVPSVVTGMWMPPQRTFSPSDPREGFRAERTRHAELVVEHQFAAFTMNARGFRQGIENQLVTLFGVRITDAPRTDVGHYLTGVAGNVVAYGWGVGVSREIARRLRGSIDYTLTHASWGNGGEALLLRTVPRRGGIQRSGTDWLHDLTTVIETVVPETATRVFAAYKLNNAYALSDFEADETGPDGRFDVQVSQRLPFLGFTNAEWEVLVAVRNLFRDQLEATSVFDELLVVRPPKRILGGLLVRF
jgi:outer membrane receptor protein involved in Fe transport